MRLQQTFHGIDFANKKKNVGHCWLVDDGATLTASFIHRGDFEATRTAIDCPFGTTVAVERLLRGEIAKNRKPDVFKSRHTERLMREVISNYQVNLDWKNRSIDERKQFPRASFFNGGSHVQPTVGLVIVPECLAWLQDRVGDGREERREELRRARLGTGRVVESHPRLFLYSAIEKVRRVKGRPLSVASMDDIAGYKGVGSEARARRQRVYEILCLESAWMGEKARKLVVEDLSALIDTDHAFDAWLSALTAWAHENELTWTWRDSRRLTRAEVEIEGHILILKIREEPGEAMAGHL